MDGEFFYKLQRTATGHRPGSHSASTLGAGHRFAGHARLFDIPDPRRIDLRASLRDMRQEWLVRTHLQRAATPVYAVVDVSASMNFGASVPKLGRAADLVESMGNSAFRAGDPAGLIVFDAADTDAIGMPARHSRSIGSVMGKRLREWTYFGSQRPSGRDSRSYSGRGRAESPERATRAGLHAAILQLAGIEALVFLVSDFHWPLELLEPALNMLNRARVVPVVVWDRAEIEPPAASGLLRVMDAETRASRMLRVGGKLRARWLEHAARRREALDALFLTREVRAFYLIDSFDPMALSRYFMDETV